jgi:hypothetical protein
MGARGVDNPIVRYKTQDGNGLKALNHSQNIPKIIIFFMGGINHTPNGRFMIGFPTLATFFALLSWSTVTFLDIFFYQLRTRLLQKETPAIVNHSQ